MADPHRTRLNATIRFPTVVLLVVLLGGLALYALQAQQRTQTSQLEFPSFVGPMLVTIGVWGVLCVQFSGLGLLLVRTVNRDGRTDFFAAFWVGLALTLGWLQFWSLWQPLSWRALALPLIVGVAGWCTLGREDLPVLRAGIAKSSRALRICVPAFVAWGALAAQAPLDVYDAGLYHLPTIRWAATFPVVPGLGNLHAAFGLGSSVFLYLASVSVGNVAGFHIGIGLLLLVLVLELMLCATQRRFSRSASRLAALLIMPALVFSGIAGLSTTMYDAVSFVLGLAIIRRLFDLLDSESLTAGAAAEGLLFVTTLGAAAITVKIANAPFNAMCFLVALYVSLWKGRLRGRALVWPAISVLVIGMALIAPWVVRNVIQTGYPLYPLPVLALPFDWTMPESTVRAYRDVLSDFARVRGPGFEGASATYAWLPGWLARSARDVVPPVVIALVAPLLMLVGAPRLARSVGGRWLILIPLWVGLVSWFLSAPDARYASFLLWPMAAIPVALWVGAVPRSVRLAMVMLFVAAVEMPNVSYVLLLAQLPVGVAVGEFAGVADVPLVALTTVTTDSGLTVFMPIEGDQVWDAPLPASGWRPAPALHQRCVDSLGCGFSVR